MSFVDELTIKLKAGSGGTGVVRWRHEKYREFAGPSGGNGGRGGSVYAEGVRDINYLAHYSQFDQLKAEPGEPGRSNSQTGGNGQDLIVKLPIGSVIYNLSTGEEFDLTEEGQSILLLSGGVGGYGNEHFKSSRNTTPKESTSGQPGEVADFKVELRLIADAGLIGLPSAGKSSLLNVLTKAKSKVGGYPFTTLEPHLGDMHGHILADIPGLIDGASAGKGLGHKFLRHISRTRLLIHCLSLESGSAIVDNYNTIRKELGDFDQSLLKKPEVVVLTKSDIVSAQELKDSLDLMKSYSESVWSVSVLDDSLVKDLKDKLSQKLETLVKDDE